ncbi:MAG: hypothetical protein AVDCRST_MAG93-5539, partial [uncultured Chloroflexia bacterium]
ERGSAVHRLPRAAGHPGRQPRLPARAWPRGLR